MDHATALLRSYFFILRWEDERQILIPALTEWSFHSPAFLQAHLSGPPVLLSAFNQRAATSEPASAS